MNALKRIAAVCVSLLYAALFLLLLGMPFPVTSSATDIRYLCTWEDGETTEESYFTARRDGSGVSSEGEVLLMREGRIGVIAPDDEMRKAFETLNGGTLAKLLALELPADPLFSAALAEHFSPYIWCYNGEYFRLGESFSPCERGEAEIFVLLGGETTAAALNACGARMLELRSGAELRYSALVGTGIEDVKAQEPYRAEESVVLRMTPSGERLIAGMPLAKTVSALTVSYADEGALLPCTQVEALDLAFVGSAKDRSGSNYRGELAHLFSTGERYEVPSTLKKVRVRGGALVSHAFYGCGSVEEIDACGVPPERIEADAFSDCTSLQSLHCARDDIPFEGNKERLPCGCTRYTRN